MEMSTSYTKINGGFPVQETNSSFSPHSGMQSGYQQSDQQRTFTRKDGRWMCCCCGYEFLNPNIKEAWSEHDIIAIQNRNQIDGVQALQGQIEYTHVLEENTDLRRKVKCKMCFEKNAEYVMIPCNHFVCCAVCVDRVRSCIVCSTPVKAVHIAKLVNSLPNGTQT